MIDRLSRKFIMESLGQPTDISKIKNSSEASFSEIAFNLYKETCLVATVASNITFSNNGNESYFDIHQGIEAGLVIRVTKLMKSVLALLCDKVSDHGDSILVLSRCILESSINLKFFCEYAKKEDFEIFIKSSLRPEKELFNIIQKNIIARGEKLPIENRMINSINQVFKSSGISSIEDLDIIPRRQDYRSILRLMDMESSYSMFQAVPSHSVHGDWVDILQNHIKEVENSKFTPDTNPIKSDTRQLCPISLLVLPSVCSYIKKYFPSGDESVIILLSRIDDLIKRTKKIDKMHEQYLSSKPI